MEKIKKIALISLIWLLTIFFISVVQTHPIPISITSAPIFQIPMIFWLVMLISPFLLYIISKDSKNPLVPLVCVILYYFIFYCYGLYFISHPTISDISSSAKFEEILPSITHINLQGFDIVRYAEVAQYFQWPVFFIFSKIFTSILGIGPIQTINLGFFSLLLILPVLLSLFYKRSNNVENATVYFILPALYLTLGWYLINSQFVPQFLALFYIFILFGCYLKYKKEKNPSFLFLMIIFYVLTVFTHSFMFIFFLVAIIFEIYWSEYVEMKKVKFISYGLIIIFFAILFPYLGTFYSMATTSVGGGSWYIFQSFFSQTTPGSGYQLQPLYHLVPIIYDQLMSSITKVVIASVFSTVAIGLLYYIFKKRSLPDLSILIGCASWFVLGLSNLVLGERALQVAALPLARYFKYPHKLFSYLSKVVVVVILIAPSLFVANDMINSSIEGGGLIQDLEENIAGRFMDKHLINESIVSAAHNPYPTGYPSGFRIFGPGYIIEQEYEWEILDFVLDSPKLQKRLMYLDILLPKNPYDSVVYDNKDIEIAFFSK